MASNERWETTRTGFGVIEVAAAGSSVGEEGEDTASAPAVAFDRSAASSASMARWSRSRRSTNRQRSAEREDMCRLAVFTSETSRRQDFKSLSKLVAISSYCPNSNYGPARTRNPITRSNPTKPKPHSIELQSIKFGERNPNLDLQHYPSRPSG